MGVATRLDTPTSGIRHCSKQAGTPTFGSKQRRTTDWVFTQDIPSDVTVEAGGMTFCLHKFPLVSRSGWIRKLVAEAKESDLSRLGLPDIPGGAEAFELAAKFCYGITFEINADNVAMLRCAGEYLDMSEDYGVNNLIFRTEAYINDVVMKSLPYSVKVLQTCESLLPIAEELDIVSRCIEASASKAYKEQLASSSSHSEYSSSSRGDSNDSLGSNCTPRKKSTESWAEELSVLRIDFFQRILATMRAHGLRYDCLGGAIVHYAQQSLRGLIKKRASHDLNPRANSKVQVHDAATALEHEQRILIETIVSLLPPERNTASIAFLFGLLRAAIHLDTTIACRLDLERRIGMQLEQATLDDLLIPSYSYSGDTLFDVDTVRRIVVNFLQQEGDDDFLDPLSMYEADSACSPPQSSMMKVARLLDCYLAEIAPDANLSPAKFISIGELMPEHARVVDDGLYRAIDIYLKAHPGVSDTERKKICARMDCRKLTQEACTHAAQNERLPVQVVVQVLYFEQLRLRTAMGGSGGGTVAATIQAASIINEAENQKERQAAKLSQRMAMATPSIDYASVCRENRELKMEVARMRMKLGGGGGANMEEEEEEGGGAAVEVAATPPNNNTAPPPMNAKPASNKFFSSFSRTLTKLNPFSRATKDSAALSQKTPDVRSRRRRHSIS